MRDIILTRVSCTVFLETLMASVAFQMESNLLADARDHDELLFDDAHEAATESDVSEFSSNDDANDAVHGTIAFQQLNNVFNSVHKSAQCMSL